jgi:hypothetical protein
MSWFLFISECANAGRKYSAVLMSSFNKLLSVSVMSLLGKSTLPVVYTSNEYDKEKEMNKFYSICIEKCLMGGTPNDQEAGESGRETSTDLQPVFNSFSPLFKSMKLFGVYFSEQHLRKRVFVLPELGGTVLEPPQAKVQDIEFEQAPSRNRKLNKLKIYSGCVLALMWINVARLSTAFLISDRFDAKLISKITVMAQMVLCAMLQMSYFIACRSGRLDGVLHEIRVNAATAQTIRRKAIVLTIIVWILIALHASFDWYLIFMTNGEFDFAMAPFGTLFLMDGAQKFALKLLTFGLNMFALPVWALPLSVNQLLTFAFFSQFQRLNNEFRRSIDDNGRFHGNMRSFRRRHQYLSRIVKSADSFIMFGNVGSFLCHMIIVIFLFYSFTFHTFGDAGSFWIRGIFLTFNGILLISTTINGIAVNHAVSISGYGAEMLNTPQY